MERLSFNRSSSALKPLATGAAAHMSLHLNLQCQRADAFPYPVLIRDTGFRLRETQTGSAESAVPVGERHIWRRLSPVNGFFSKSSRRRFEAFQPGRSPRKDVPARSRKLRAGPSIRAFRKAKPAILPAPHLAYLGRLSPPFKAKSVLIFKEFQRLTLLGLAAGGRHMVGWAAPVNPQNRASSMGT